MVDRFKIFFFFFRSELDQIINNDSFSDLNSGNLKKN